MKTTYKLTDSAKASIFWKRDQFRNGTCVIRDVLGEKQEVAMTFKGCTRIYYVHITQLQTA